MENGIVSAPVEKKIFRDQLITLGDLEKFKTELLADLQRLIQSPAQNQQKQWLKSVEVRKLLGISPGTLQTLRINGTLPFSKIGSLIYYKYEDIYRLLENTNKQ